MLTFKELELTDKNLVNSYIDLFKPEASEISFTNLYLWRKYYKTQLCVHEDFLCISFEKSPHQTVFLPPLGTYHQRQKLLHTIVALHKFQKTKNQDLIFTRCEERIQENLSGLFPRFCEAVDNRDQYDYVYETKKLINLPGTLYHKKRNRISKFNRENPEYLVEPLSAENTESALAFLDSLTTPEQLAADPMLAAEYDGIKEILIQQKSLDFVGMVIKIADRVVALTLGEKLNATTAVIHIEKADKIYNGIFPAINQLFCEYCWYEMPFINREQDLGLPGLRFAKEEYFPCKMIKKFDVNIPQTCNLRLPALTVNLIPVF